MDSAKKDELLNVVSAALDAVEAPTEQEEPRHSFFQSTRFWVMVLGAVAVYVQAKGWLGEDERNLIATLAAGFITIKTLDRGAEKMGAK